MKSGHIEVPFGAQNLKIECGILAKQANAAVTLTYGGTVVLVTVCMAKKAVEGNDFLPLMVEYQEKTYSAGRIPGGFFKREGRPTQKEILSSRLIDRPIRPLFPAGLVNDIQVVATVLSSDGENDPDVLAVIGASTALTISDIPFNGPVGAVRVCCKDGKYIINPTYTERENSPLELVVVGLENGIVMIEGETKEVPEDKINEALEFAFKHLQPIREIQNQFQKQVGVEKAKVKLLSSNPQLTSKVKGIIGSKLADIYKIKEKSQREEALNNLFDGLIADLTVYDDCKVDEKAISEGDILKVYDEIQYEEVRKLIFEEQKRADGRGLKEIREISGNVGVLPRTHGSALFTRGQTQSLAVVTLGTRRDEQMIEALDGVSYEDFMLHYNFPSFSVGEARPMRGPGRREIGHGALAAKALKAVLPSKDVFPYTIRVVSEILESNGSSSMASVCAGSLSLMDAGVPIARAVAGISIGLVTDGEKYKLITDIMGLEDHFGDMDFKVAGTTSGVTAIQLDIKLESIPVKILTEGIAQAKEARTIILEKMKHIVANPKADISDFAPKIIITQIPPDKIGEVIGPGGKMIKKIIEETKAEAIDIDDDGKVHIAALNKESAEAALKIIQGLVEVPVIGKTYKAKVTKIANFGAFCEFLPGRSGLVHVSELADNYVKDVESVVKVGDEIRVKLIEIDQMNRANLSKKQADK